MEVKHDLDAINAALCLGDKFIPPPGACFELIPWQGELVIDDVTGLEFRGRAQIAYHLGKGRPRGELLIAADDFHEHVFPWSRLTFVPNLAPPFREWERL